MRIFLVMFLIVTFFSQVTFANDLKNKYIKFHNPTIKFFKSNHKVTSGYLTIENIGEENLILKSVSSNISENTEIHDMKIEQDIMKMEKIMNTKSQYWSKNNENIPNWFYKMLISMGISVCIGFFLILAGSI